MTKVGIFGISGYAGQKLVELLVSHSEVEITAGFVAPEEGTPEITEIIPKLKCLISLRCKNTPDWKDIEKNCDVVFLALPHNVSMKFVPPLVEMKKKIIDLSADFRFDDIKIYERFYTKHTSPQLNSSFIYGLPEINRDKIKNTDFVANPGCYPTSVILALLPLVKNNLIEDRIFVDSKSGVTGAGRTPSLGTLFVECNENIKAYKIGEHRHQPEMEEVINKAGNRKYSITFVPHLVPYNQGILSTLYVTLQSEIAEEKLQEIYERTYADEPFVRVMKYGVSPEVKNIVNTNFCDIGIKLVDSKTLVVISVIDNLIKGASGQAVQNMNIMLGLKETLPFF
ncbi:MAG: N-acetyl-gamma-glutamyl-phosphate reductase [Candidatus Omnitrophica bacterium]|nr:N-acetyl-gamma-glutamyl-phosphate reductase [Candidatus Omnitrophota bacterium]MCM8777343.1 N-acetyl-gamma-glutamyl-phosphate reductase [Candidatus Omnitrophota bacterium]